MEIEIAGKYIAFELLSNIHKISLFNNYGLYAAHLEFNKMIETTLQDANGDITRARLNKENFINIQKEIKKHNNKDNK